MNFVKFVLKYLAIGCLIGAGIILVDQLFIRYGNPYEFEFMESLVDDLSKIYSDTIEFSGLGSEDTLTFFMFGKEIKFEERCKVFLKKFPSFRCNDSPHFTSIALSNARNLDETVLSIQRTAQDDTLEDIELDEFRVVRYFVDHDKLYDLMIEKRSEPQTEPSGNQIKFPEIPPMFTAYICKNELCFRISSGSRTKVEGLIAQIIAP